ncbi:MAG: Gldg family protein [Planctomycetota bacterium]|nr:Gldg family protein [Planctomycetota bacterium]
MANKNYLTWSHSILSCVLLFLVVLLLNVVVAGAGVRVDLTQEGLYTLDKGSRNILERLRDPVAITVYWGNVPAQAAVAERFIEGLLEEMQEVAGDKLSVTWIDTDEEEGQQEAEKNNIQLYSFRRTEGNKRVETTGYMTMVIESGADGPTTIDQLARFYTQLEAILVADIDKRSRLSPRTIGYINPDSPLFLSSDVTGRGRRPGRFNYLKDEWLRRRAFGKELQDVQSLEEPVPADIDVLLVVAPWQLPEVAAFHLEQFALRGGRIFLLLDSVNVENAYLPNQEREPRSSGLEEWLAHVGVTVEYGLVGDFNRANQSFYGFNREEQGRYPYWPQLTQEYMDTTNVVMNSIPAMITAWPAAITIDDTRMEEGERTVKVLAQTSPLGHRRAEIGAVGEKLSHPLPSTKEFEQIPLIVMIDGPLESMWKGKDKPLTPAQLAEAAAKKAAEANAEPLKDEAIEDDAPLKDDEVVDDKPLEDDEVVDEPPLEDTPEKDKELEEPAPPKEDEKPAGGDGGEGDDGEEPPAGDDEDGASEDEKKEEGPPRLDTGKVKILIASDAEYCADYFQGQDAGFAFVVGMADWLSGGEDLINLRARNTNPRQIEAVEASTQKTIQVVNLGAIPFLLLCVGIVVFAVRRSQRS